MNNRPNNEFNLMCKCESNAEGQGIDCSLSLSYPNFEYQIDLRYQQIRKYDGEEYAKNWRQIAWIDLSNDRDAYDQDRPFLDFIQNDLDLQPKIEIGKFQKLTQSSMESFQEVFVEKEKQTEYQWMLYNQWKEQRKSSLSQWKTIDQKFKKRLRQCIPLQFIARQKITNLKVIHIVYHQPKKNMPQCFRYSVSAFQLFKLIHRSRQLKEATIKGVQIQLFQQFLRKLRAVKKDKQNKVYNWMKDFKPSKSLKLSLSAELKFYISDRLKCGHRINQLFYFTRMFSVVSDIIVQIQVGKCKDSEEWTYIMYKLVTELNKIQNIRVKAHIGRKYMCRYNDPSLLRSTLFGGLASLTSIAHLQLNNIDFTLLNQSPTFLLAIQQTMRIIFQNNAITHLKLNSCAGFPVLPKITTLQSIHHNSSFRRPYVFSALLRSNPQLKSIECSSDSQQWTISDNLFNKLQTLSIGCFCDEVFLGDLQRQQLSNIKQLRIGGSQFAASLPNIIPKLSLIACLKLYHINFGDFALPRIPSPYLEQLSICRNEWITEKGIKKIDRKWPYLRYIQLRWCRRLSGSTWMNCEFKGLMELNVYLENPQVSSIDGKKSLQLLRSKGVHYSLKNQD